MLKQSKTKTILFTAAYLLFLFQIALLSVIPAETVTAKIIQYSDDVIECVLIVCLAAALLKKEIKLSKVEIVLCCAAALFSAIGVVSSLVNRFQPFFVWATDTLVCVRFVVFYISARVFFNDPGENKKVLKTVSVVCKAVAVIVFITCIYDMFAVTPLFARNESRYLTTSRKMFFGTQSEFGAFMFCIGMPIAASGALGKKRNLWDLAFLFMAMFSAYTCGRAKTIAGAAAALVLYTVFCVFRLKTKSITDIVLFGGIAAGACAFGFDRIKAFYLNKKMARSILFRYSFKFADRFFPLGTGFGTFGTATAYKNWSPLYQEVDFSVGYEVYDVFWPGVIAQTGYIGTVAFLTVLACFLVKALSLKKNSYFYITALSILFYLAFSSFGEAAFFHPMFSSLFILFGMCVNLADEK